MDEFNQLVIASLERLDGAIGRLEGKIDGVNDRMDNLVDTTNHRLENFETALGKKADKRELIVPVVSRLLSTWKRRFVAFSAGISAAIGAGISTYHFIWPRIADLF